MKISDLVAELNSFWKSYGNIEVECYSRSGVCGEPSMAVHFKDNSESIKGAADEGLGTPDFKEWPYLIIGRRDAR